MTEEDLLDKALEILGESGAAESYRFILANKACAGDHGSQLRFCGTQAAVRRRSSYHELCHSTGALHFFVMIIFFNQQKPNHHDLELQS